jgi:salicylate 5-hydroxylase large subunit
LSQKAFESKPFHRTLAEPGDRDVVDADHRVTKTPLLGICRDGREITEAES